MSLTQLPAVAKSFFTLCKKCDADRYHTVLAHTTSKTAKIKCEVCGSTKSYTLPKAAGAKKTGTTRKPSAATESARRSTHNAEYETLMGRASQSEVPYNMKGKFEINQKVKHSKFGLGIVKDALPDRIEIVFADEIRALIHNRV